MVSISLHGRCGERFLPDPVDAEQSRSLRRRKVRRKLLALAAGDSVGESLRALWNVTGEINLVCLALNLRRMANMIRRA